MNRLVKYTQQAAVEAGQDSLALTVGAWGRFMALSTAVKSAMLLAFLTGYYTVFSSMTWATTGSTKSGGDANCGNTQAGEVLDAISNVAQIIMFFVGGLVVLMFMIGGALIVVGGKSSRVQQGFTILKNALIGLAVVAVALFIQEFVLSVVGAAFGTDTPGCLDDGRESISGIE